MSTGSTRNNGPRVICVGSNEESEVVLRTLLDAGASVVGLVTRPKGSSAGISDYVDLGPLCHQFGVAVVGTENINAPGTIAEMAALEPDYIYTLGWSQLFGADLLSTPSHYVVGSHPSLLPAGRGRAPVPWTILQGETSTAVSLFKMDIGVDAGPILVQRRFDVPADATSRTLYDLVADNLARAFMTLYELHASGAEIVETAQDIEMASHRAKRTPADGHLDFSRPAAELERLVRAASQPYPGAYSYYQGRRIEIWSASLDGVPAYVGVQGQVLLKQDGRVLVQAGDGPLWLYDFTSADEHLDVRELKVGSTFGYRVEDTLHRLEQVVAEIRGAEET